MIQTRNVEIGKCTACNKPIVDVETDFGDGIWTVTESNTYDYKGHICHSECMDRTEWIVNDRTQTENTKHINGMNARWYAGDKDGMNEKEWEQFGRLLSHANEYKEDR